MQVMEWQHGLKCDVTWAVRRLFAVEPRLGKDLKKRVFLNFLASLGGAATESSRSG